jgi:formylglycine-generating enzyme required for sulfatase activity
MGDQSSPSEGYSSELPVHTVQVSAFYMAKHLVTKEQWDSVRAWGLTHGYTDLSVGAGKAGNHPVHTITWYDMVKWCNARSQNEGLTPCYTVKGQIYQTGVDAAVACNWSANGYRLPTEAEWEKAARGGLSGKRFPCGDTLSHTHANFLNRGGEAYQTGTPEYHPDYKMDPRPFTSPVGSLAPNGHGLYDMTGNVWERCWDWYGAYPASGATDPRGPTLGAYRVYRGGGWDFNAFYCRVAFRSGNGPGNHGGGSIGFRVARSSVP